MPENHYDYIIVGNGLAGLQLASALSRDAFFKDKQIALIDPSTKTKNDKTWSFWETEPSQWNHLIHKSWQIANIFSNKKLVQLNLNPYSYKSIRAIDFYKSVKSQIKKKSNFSFIIGQVTSVIENNTVEVKTEANSYTANHVFDSRISSDFKINSNKYITLIQHFKGWVIRTNKDAFNPDEFTKMDYRIKDGEQTTFMYVLPFTKNEALIEFTYFTENIVDQATYDHYITTYIKDYLKIDDYDIVESEIGQIPMTNFPFEKSNTKQVTKIGTAGGWVKGSSGYSFKNTEKKVNIILDNLKADRLPSRNLFKRKYKFFDKVFLKVLKDENHKGEWVFQEFYGRNSIKTMFRFLDEESSFFEEIKVMISLFSWSFIKAFFKTL